MATLKQADVELNEILKKLEETDPGKLQIDHFGTKMGFVEFSHVIIQHDSIHQGLWSLYARTAGFPTPGMEGKLGALIESA